MSDSCCLAPGEVQVEAAFRECCPGRDFVPITEHDAAGLAQGSAPGRRGHLAPCPADPWHLGSPIRHQKKWRSQAILLAQPLAAKQQKIGLAREGEGKQGLNGPNAGAVWAWGTYPQILWITLCVKIEKGAPALAATGLEALFKKYRLKSVSIKIK